MQRQCPNLRCLPICTRADDDASARRDMLFQYSGVYAALGCSLYSEWLELLRRRDGSEAQDLLAYALHNREPMPPSAALDWLQVQFEALAPLWHRLGCRPD